MGKNLKGKECGKGIYQRKDGTYHARFTDRSGKEQGKYFKTVPELREYLFGEQTEQLTTTEGGKSK